MGGKHASVEERFERYVDRSADGDGCWPWTGATDTQGYGTIFAGVGRTIRKAHRVAWEIAHGPIPAGLEVCHRCDNPPCVRLDHLFLGTHAENMRDMVVKGRRKNRHAAATHCDRGHEWTEASTIHRPLGQRACRACVSLSARAAYARRRAAAVR